MFKECRKTDSVCSLPRKRGRGPCGTSLRNIGYALAVRSNVA